MKKVENDNVKIYHLIFDFFKKSLKHLTIKNHNFNIFFSDLILKISTSNRKNVIFFFEVFEVVLVQIQRDFKIAVVVQMGPECGLFCKLLSGIAGQVGLGGASGVAFHAIFGSQAKQPDHVGGSRFLESHLDLIDQVPNILRALIVSVKQL